MALATLFDALAVFLLAAMVLGDEKEVGKPLRHNFILGIKEAMKTVTDSSKYESAEQGAHELVEPCVRQSCSTLTALNDSLTLETRQKLFSELYGKVGAWKQESQAKRAFECAVEATVEYGSCVHNCKDRKCGIDCAQQKLNGGLSECKMTIHWSLGSHQSLSETLKKDFGDRIKQLEPQTDHHPSLAERAARPIVECRRNFVKKTLNTGLAAAKTEGEAQTLLLDYFYACGDAGAAGLTLPALPALLAAAEGALIFFAW